MAPLTPHWVQPSHPAIQRVIPSSPDEFTTKSISTISLPPYALFAKLSFPPCTPASEPTYATVQMGVSSHLNLNSDLVYINHSCEPSVIFDMSSLTIIAGANGLREGEELTFFYPSTEWDMAQGFDCFCGKETCRGYIRGAKNMTAEQLQGMWLNAHIRELLEERDNSSKKSVPEPATNGHGSSGRANGVVANGKVGANGGGALVRGPTELVLVASLEQARKMVKAAQKALDVYMEEIHGTGRNGNAEVAAEANAGRNGVGSRELSGEMGGDTRLGVTSREMSGEMGGDTVVSA